MKTGPLALICSLFAVSSVNAATVEAWRMDVRQVVKDLESTHPDPFARVGKLTFLRRAAALEEDLPVMTEEQRMVGAMRLVALVGDGHTQLSPSRPDFALWYPIRIYEFSDGDYVTAAHDSEADLAGAKVLEVAGRPAAEVVEAARDLWGSDNAFASQENVFAFSDAALMKGLGFAEPDGTLRIKFRLAGGKVVERRLAPHRSDDARYAKDDSTLEWRFQAEMGGPPFGGVDHWISAYRSLPYAAFRTTDLSRPPRLMNRRYFASKSLPDKDAYYIQSNFIGEDIAQQFDAALKEVDRLKPRRLIIDFRYNFGGDGSHLPEVARAFIQRQAAPPWKELYVITGRRTLSAGIMAVLAITRNVPSTVIGEPMAAPDNSFGDPVEIDYPHAGMILDVSTVRHQLGEAADIGELSRVDVPVDMSFQDYASGADPAVDPILRGEDMRSLLEIARMDGGAAAQRAWAVRKARSSAFPWWRPPAEVDMRLTEQAMLAAGKVDDALALAELSAELHPDVWNAWYNLGHAQLAAGRKAQALESWRRVLQIDPTNPNADEIRKAFTDAGQPPP